MKDLNNKKRAKKLIKEVAKEHGIDPKALKNAVIDYGFTLENLTKEDVKESMIDSSDSLFAENKNEAIIIQDKNSIKATIKANNLLDYETLLKNALGAAVVLLNHKWSAESTKTVREVLEEREGVQK